MKNFAKFEFAPGRGVIVANEFDEFPDDSEGARIRLEIGPGARQIRPEVLATTLRRWVETYRLLHADNAHFLRTEDRLR